MKDILIVGTDTGSGKTIITGLLLRFFRVQNINAISQKWIQTGSTKFSLDLKKQLSIAGIANPEIKPYLRHMNPYCLKFPGSPHLASTLENRTIRPHKINDSYYALKKKFELILVEGTGGALVPYSNKNLIIDIAKKLPLQALVVINNRLGAINHALLTIEALKKRKIPILGIIFNQTNKIKSSLILEDNKNVIHNLTKIKIIGCLPFEKNIEKLYHYFKPIGESLIT